MEIPRGPLRTAPAEAIWFSPRQRQVLPGIVAGWSYKEIAGAMKISEKTVQLHVCGLLRRLNLRDRKELQAWCAQNPADVRLGVTRSPGLHEAGCSCGSEYCSLRRSLLGLAA
jgi:DNA-binding CsgD family transcriptional regulator